MKVIIVGTGRVGAAIAQRLAAREARLTLVDSDPDSFMRLGESFPADMLVGHALDSELMERAGVADADAFIACTDDDNTNLVISQIAKRRYGVQTVVVRVFDPDKAEFFSTKGLSIVCPTLKSIDEMTAAVERSENDLVSEVADAVEATT